MLQSSSLQQIYGTRVLHTQFPFFSLDCSSFVLHSTDWSSFSRPTRPIIHQTDPHGRRRRRKERRRRKLDQNLSQLRTPTLNLSQFPRPSSCRHCWVCCLTFCSCLLWQFFIFVSLLNSRKYGVDSLGQFVVFAQIRGRGIGFRAGLGYMELECLTLEYKARV